MSQIADTPPPAYTSENIVITFKRFFTFYYNKLIISKTIEENRINVQIFTTLRIKWAQNLIKSLQHSLRQSIIKVQPPPHRLSAAYFMDGPNFKSSIYFVVGRYWFLVVTFGGALLVFMNVYAPNYFPLRHYIFEPNADVREESAEGCDNTSRYDVREFCCGGFEKPEVSDVDFQVCKAVN
jgi:hypothetical protein